MSERFWRNLCGVAGLIALFVMAAYVLLTANLELKDVDLWLHRATGSYIIEHQVVPHHDIWSGSLNEKTWINHEWLFQVVVAALHQWQGTEALIAFRSGCHAFIFALLLILGVKMLDGCHRPEGFLLALCGMIPLVFLLQYRPLLRPDLLSLCAVSAYMFILNTALSRRASVWWLVLIQILWVNTHGFFLLGPLMVFMVLGGEWLKRHTRLPWQWAVAERLSEETYLRLKQILAAVALVSLFNPYGFTGVWYPFKILFSLSQDQQIFFQHIGELQRPLTWRNVFSADLWAYKLMLVMTLVSFVFNYRRVNITRVGTWIIFLLFSLSIKRNVVFFGVMGYGIIVANIAACKAWKHNRWLDKHFEKRIILIILFYILMIVGGLEAFGRRVLRGYFNFDTYSRQSEYGGMSLLNFPHQAGQFLVDHEIKGKFFNNFNSAAYLIGKTQGKVEVFIDGRTELYGGHFFELYQSMLEGNPHLCQQVMEAYQLTGAFISFYHRSVPVGLIKFFAQSSEWHLVYFDHDAVIFLKQVPEHQKVIKDFSIDITTWKPPLIDWVRLGGRSVGTDRFIHRAKALAGFKKWDKARQQAQEAIRIKPYDEEAYRVLARIAQAQKEWQDAFIYFRAAKMINPQNLDTRDEMKQLLKKLQE